MSVRKAILNRIKIAFVIVGIFSFGILYQIYKLQFVEGEKWEEISRTKGFQFRRVNATRGDLLSDDGRLLASSLPFYRVAFDPTQAADSVFDQKLDSLAFHLAQFFEEEDSAYYAETLRNARADTNRYKVLSRKLVSYRQKQQLEQWPIFRQGRIGGGVIFEKVEQRFQPYEPLARRTIGFVSRDTANQVIGRGLEYSFHKQLAGRDGEALYQRVPGGWKPVHDENRVMPVNGYDIVTTLDIEAQKEATKILESHLRKHRADYGALILMEVQTGEIKALANLTRSEGQYIEDYNYAIQGVREPGSTFKLASVMALLEERPSLSLEDTVLTGDGEYLFYEDCIMTDDALYGYGSIPFRSVFEKSSNIGVSRKVFEGFQANKEKFIEYLKKFGLTEPIDFQMMGEGTPFINQPGLDTWSGCSLPWMSIGYEVQLSPLQLLAFYNGVANDGKMIEPIIARQIRDGQIPIQSFEPRIINPKLCSDRTLRTVRSLLEGVVARGTARSIRSDQYTIAGKTGTAQKFQGGKYTKQYYASFVGYFPAEKPTYSCIVVIDQPRGDAQYGGEVAAPVFRELADWMYIRRITLDLKPTTQPAYTKALPYIRAGYAEDLAFIGRELGLPMQQGNHQYWVKTNIENDSIISLQPQVWEEDEVPNVVGMTFKDALYLLENRGMNIRSAGNGHRITRQSLKPGTKINRRKQVIYLRLG